MLETIPLKIEREVEEKCLQVLKKRVSQEELNEFMMRES